MDSDGDGFLVVHSPGGLLISRLLFVIAGQLLVALVLWATGDATPVSSAGRWWLVTVTVGNVVTLGLLAAARRHAGGVRSLWRFNRATWKGDLGWFLAFTVLAGRSGGSRT